MDVLKTSDNYEHPAFMFSNLGIFTSAFIIAVLLQCVIRKLLSIKKGNGSTECSKYIDSLHGPRGIPFFGPLYQLRDYKNALKTMQKFADDYGPIYTFKVLNERFVLVSSAPLAQAVLATAELGHISKAPVVYENVLGEVLRQGLVTSSGEHWQTHRKILSRGFTYKALRTYCKLFNKCSLTLVSKLEAQFPENDNQYRPISRLIHYCGIEIIAEVVLGIDTESGDEAMRLYDVSKVVKNITSYRTRAPWLYVKPIWRLHPLSRKFYAALDSLNGIITQMIEKHKVEHKNSPKLAMTIQKGEVEEEEPCGNMIELMYRSGFCDQEILDEVNTMINAGFETTSGAVHFLMFLLALNQEHQLICRQEIDSVFNDPMKCQNGILSCDALSDMKHLERCILETLRIFPLAFSMMRKLDIPLKLDEKTELPAGTTVGVLNFTLHNNPEYFPNPTEFQPDRFLPENCRKRHPYAYMPFSVGPRNCIGMKFAMLESKTMAAHILRNFEVCTNDKIGDVAILPDILMTPERDYNFLLRKRVHPKTHLK